MKQTILTIAVAMMASASALGAGEALMPEQCSIGDHPFVRPLEYVEFTFDGEIAMGDTPVAAVYGEDNFVMAADFEVSNYQGSKRTQGTLIIWFDKQNLPLGQDYRLMVGEGTVKLAEDDECKNNEINVDFSVPADLGPHTFNYEENSVIAKTRSIWIYWGFETDPVREPQFELYHDETLIGVYPAHVGWDWDLGQAYVDFGDEIRFDRDEHYAIVLPAGSVKSCYRDDLVNREARLNFIGGSDAPEPDPLQYEWCSIYTDHSNVYNEIWFRYRPGIVVSEGATIQLYDMDRNVFVAEASAWLNTDANCSLVVCDFGGFQLEDGVGYTLVVPEGTVYFDNEDGSRIYNKRQGLNVTGDSLTELVIDDDGDESELYDLMGRRVREPLPGGVYIRKGRKVVY